MNALRNECIRRAAAEVQDCLEDFVRRRTLLEQRFGRAALCADPGLPEAARILFGEEAGTELDRYKNTGGPS